MSAQTTLDEDPPMILDATCSYSHIWPKHASIRMHIRPEVLPDVVGDIRKTGFPNSFFDEVYIDPPHLFRKSKISRKLAIKRRLSGRLSPTRFERYGFFMTREEWLNFLGKVNIEAKRILKPTGILHWKLTFGKGSTYVKEKDLELLTNFVVIQKKVTTSKANWSSKKNPVHWLTMKPKKSTPD